MIDKSDVISGKKTEDELQEKQEIMASVVEELKNHGDINE